MKSRQVAEILRNQGAERGTQVILEALVEDVNTMKKAISELAGMQDKQLDMMSNVINGAHAMRGEMMKAMSKAGLLEHEDDLHPSTQALGDPDATN